MSESPVMLITGGARGIGVATARLAASRGLTVCVNYRRSHEAAERLVPIDCGKWRTLIGHPGRYQLRGWHLSTPSASRFRIGQVSALVNNAATLARQMRLDAMDGARITRILAGNVIGSIICAREAVRRMNKAVCSALWSGGQRRCHPEAPGVTARAVGPTAGRNGNFICSGCGDLK
jgi:NAD(P)-dependent dehydrogenase (short-subunit alcohol dehydrogenase family)